MSDQDHTMINDTTSASLTEGEKMPLRADCQIFFTHYYVLFIHAFSPLILAKMEYQKGLYGNISSQRVSVINRCGCYQGCCSHWGHLPQFFTKKVIPSQHFFQTNYIQKAFKIRQVAQMIHTKLIMESWFNNNQASNWLLRHKTKTKYIK